MHSVSLAGRLILVCEDEPFIGLDIAKAFQGAGARVATVSSVRDALANVEDALPSAAVLDYVLKDGDTSPVCEWLKERSIPFVLYSNVNNLEGACGEAVHLFKPVGPDVLVSAVVDLLQRQPQRHFKPAKENSDYQHLMYEFARTEASIEAGKHRVAEHRKLVETLRPKDELQTKLSIALHRNLEVGLELLRHRRETVRRELNSLARRYQRKLAQS